MVFYVRQFVQSIIDEWGAEVFHDNNQHLYYDFYTRKSRDDSNSITEHIKNIKAYGSLDVFFKGAYSEHSVFGSRCVILNDVVLTPEVTYYARKYDTQDGKVRDAEMLVYSLMREMYIRRYADGQPNALSAGEDAPIRILYLGRPRDNTRYVINENELITKLNDVVGEMKGAELSVHHDFGSLPFADQLKISASSDIMIGPHGAGLTHVLFMKPQSVLIELIPNAWADPGYRNLALFSGKVYLFWQQTNESLSEDTVRKGDEVQKLGRSNNFYVDLDDTGLLVKAAMRIVSMVGSRYWPDCPGYEFLHYARAVPIKCPHLWKRDEGVKGETPKERMF
jgi:hypothetical protein